MNVFITGATGFIGINLVKRLKETEHKLYCLVRKTSQIREIEELGVNLIFGDLTDKDSMLESMRGIDCVINLAGTVSLWEPDKSVFTEVNVEGTRNVMECALETGVSKVVHISTVGIYGKPADSPFTEDSPVGPIRFSEYARTKYEGELIAWELYEKKELPLVVIYPGMVLGPDDPKPVGRYIKNVLNHRLPDKVFLDSNFTYVHVMDVAEVIVRAVEKEDIIGEKYLVGRQQLSMREFNEMIREISGVSLPKLTLPDWMVMVNAILLTGLVDITKKPPIWDMSTDQVITIKEGFRAKGSKAERELGLTYTPIRVALEEAIASFQ
jgi:dihydroflavonol-4-reductase